MAVKQNAEQAGSGSTSAAQNGKAADKTEADHHSVEEKNEGFGNMLAIIEAFSSPEQIGVLTGAAQIQFRMHLVRFLVALPPPRDKNSLKQFKEDLTKVLNFLSTVNDKNVTLPYLEMVFKLIANDDATSPAVAIVFQLFEKDYIDKALSLVWARNEHLTDADIQRVVVKLCDWNRTYNIFPKLHLWIIAILEGIKDQQRFSLLFDIAMDVIDNLFVGMAIPVLRSQTVPVIRALLTSVKHTPIIFNKIAVRAPKVLNQLQQESEKDEDVKKTLQNLVDMLSALMDQFQSDDELCKVLAETLSQFTPSYDYQSTLNFHYWCNSPLSKRSIEKNAKVGLVNLGNTCYMNSVLQALARTREFSREIVLSECNAQAFLRMQELVALMLYSTRPELTPSLVLHAIKPQGFVCGVQQDSSEFLGHLLETLHEQEKNSKYALKNIQSCNVGSSAVVETDYQNAASGIEKAKPESIIEKTFSGKISTIFRCLTCRWESRNTDSFRDLQLSFPDFKNDCASNYSVQDLLDYYCSPETLDGENRYFCEKCRRLTDAQRMIQVVNAPNNLILTLKHFKYDQNCHMRAKLMHKVFHDENISLKVRSNDSQSDHILHYNLYAAVVHSGVSMDSGHYYTYATDDKVHWYNFNDNLVSTCSISDLHNLSPPNTPYILFYQMNAISKDEGNSNIQTVPIETPSLPKLEELPSRLNEFFRNDEYLYRQGQRNREKQSTISAKSMSSRTGNRDDDDEPPGSFSDKSFGNFNRFVY